jgi:hypothetical protein
MNISVMLSQHPFWGIITIAVLVWYSTITIYVGVRGALDIKHMLRNLKEKGEAAADEKKS